MDVSSRPPGSVGRAVAFTSPPAERLHLCVWCEQEVPDRDWPAHMAGRDAARLACPHQDVEAVRAAHEPRTGLLREQW